MGMRNCPPKRTLSVYMQVSNVAMLHWVSFPAPFRHGKNCLVTPHLLICNDYPLDLFSVCELSSHLFTLCASYPSCIIVFISGMLCNLVFDVFWAQKFKFFCGHSVFAGLDYEGHPYLHQAFKITLFFQGRLLLIFTRKQRSLCLPEVLGKLGLALNPELNSDSKSAGDSSDMSSKWQIFFIFME